MFRFGLLGAFLLAGLLLALLMGKGSEENARAVAAEIAAECGVTVAARRSASTDQLGLSIAAVAPACRKPGDFAKIGCARKRISESHFTEVEMTQAGPCAPQEARS